MANRNRRNTISCWHPLAGRDHVQRMLELYMNRQVSAVWPVCWDQANCTDLLPLRLDQLTATILLRSCAVCCIPVDRLAWRPSKLGEPVMLLPCCCCSVCHATSGGASSNAAAAPPLPSAARNVAWAEASTAPKLPPLPLPLLANAWPSDQAASHCCCGGVRVALRQKHPPAAAVVLCQQHCQQLLHLRLHQLHQDQLLSW